MKKTYSEEEIKNMVFGYLTPISRYTKDGRAHWICSCVCGSELSRREDYLTSYRHNIHSCGCHHPRKDSNVWKGKNSFLYKGAGNLNGQYFSEIRCRAKRNNLEFNITIDYAWCLFLEQQGLCALTGLPLNFESCRDKKKGIQQSASLDRKDSTKGYVPDNIQWIHKDVNRMKNHYSQERFIEICKLVAKRA